MANQYEAARDIYAAWGVDTEEALRKMDTIPVSINCWQLDDLTGFEDFDAALTGGIAATGNAPGKPRSVEEYFVSLDKMLSLVPGAKHLALHAVYPLTNGVKVPRNEIRPEHFAGWVDYAREKGINHIVTGVSQTDFSGYPDCRDTFIKSLNVTLNLAMDGQFVFHTPLMWIDKAETWALADELGVLDLIRHETLTCYNGIPGDGCGHCPACKLRREGLEKYLAGKG